MKKNIVKLLIILAAFFFLNNLFLEKAQAAACTSVPITGNYTVSTSCAFGDTIDGVDTGSGTTNTASITVNATKTLTINSGQTVAYGSITNNGTIVLNADKTSVLSQNPIWMTDQDADGYSTSTTQIIQASAPTNGRRRNLMTSISVVDCAGTDATKYQNLTGYDDTDGDGYTTSTTTQVCSGASFPAYNSSTNPYRSAANGSDCLDTDATFYQTVANIATDADNDGYYTGSAASTCVGASSTINGRTYYIKTAGNYDYAVSTAELGANDCNDASATTWQNLTGYTDADGDGWPANTTPVNNLCSGASVPSGYIGSLPANGQGSDIASITSTTALPAIRDSFQAATATIGSSTYIYAIGGTTDLVSGAGASSTVYKATINNSTGDVGAWSTTGQAQLPKIEKHMGVTGHALTVNGTHYLYGIGQYSSAAAWSTIYKFLLSSSGDVTSITSAGNFPTLIYDNTVEGITIGSSSYIYSAGGWPVISSTYTSTINNTTGNIGTTTADNALPATRYNGSMAIAQMSSGTSYIYYTGGWQGGASDFSTVYRTTIDSTGGMGAWTSTSQLLKATDAHGNRMPLIVSGPKAFMYHLTGWNPPQSYSMSNVYKASIDAAGAVSAFSATNQTQLTSATTVESGATVTARVGGTDDYIYILGGYNDGTTNDTASVMKASFSQTNIDCNDADATLHPDSGC